MKLPNTNMWMIRAGQNAHVLDYFLNRGIAYLGWDKTGPVYPETVREDLASSVEKANPTLFPLAIGNATRCIWEFCREIRIGDDVVIYDPHRRQYYVGVVSSDAEYTTVIWHYADTGNPFDAPGYERRVNWVSAVARYSLPQSARNYLGRPPTHLLLPEEVSKEIRRLCV